MKATHSMRLAPVILCLLWVSGALGGCMLPKRSTPPRPWVLSAMAGEPELNEISVTLGVGPVEFPDYLKRPEILERVGPNELRVNEFDIWGESLRSSFQDTLAYNLSLLVPGLAVVEFPWKGPSEADYRLSMVVSRFEHDVPSGEIVLDVRWALVRTSGWSRIADGVRVFREPVRGEGFAAITAAMSRAVEALSREISALPELRGDSRRAGARHEMERI